MDQTVVGAGPDHTLLQGRFADRIERAVDLFAGSVARDRFAARALRALGAGGEIGADLFPGDAAIARAVHELRTVVDRARIVRRDLHGRNPLEAVDQVAARIAVERLHADPVALLVGGVQVEAAELALATAVDQFGMFDIGNDGTGLATGTGAEILAVAQRQAGHDDGGVVLLRAVDAVGILIVHRHLVNLGGGLVHLRAPGAAAIQRDVGPAIVGLNHVLRILAD